MDEHEADPNVEELARYRRLLLWNTDPQAERGLRELIAELVERLRVNDAADA